MARRAAAARLGPRGPRGAVRRATCPAVPPAALWALDQTRLSFDHIRVQSLEAQVLAQPEVRQAKVQSLQQAIGNGEYSVSAGQIAAAMASDLGSGAQG